jgi:UDP-N-acetylglucosamine 3-dehydrogenase
MALKKRLVVVGLGSIGKRHARLLAERDNITVELCDPSTERLNEAIKERGEMPSHHSFDRMIESKPDMVLIATPHHLHVEQTIAALRSGAHVICEKPMSDRLSNAKKVLETTLNKGQVLSYGFSNHFHPGILKVRELMNSGSLGEIRYIHFHIGTYGTLLNSISRYQEETEGALLMDYVHQPDLLYWMLGKNPRGVYASGGEGGNMEISSNPNAITLVLDYDSGLTSSIHLNYIQFPDRYHLECVGDRGWVYYDLISNTCTVGRRNDTSISREVLYFERDSIYKAEHQAFFDAIEGKRSPESPAEEAIQSMVVLEAALQSWKTKQRILLEGIGL